MKKNCQYFQKPNVCHYSENGEQKCNISDCSNFELRSDLCEVCQKRKFTSVVFIEASQKHMQFCQKCFKKYIEIDTLIL